MAHNDLPHPGYETLLSSAARTTTQTGTTMGNHDAAGVIITVAMTAVTATLMLTPKVQYSPDGGTTWVDYCVAAIALAAIANSSYLIYPGILASADGAMTESFNLPLPRTWRLVVTAGNGVSATYAAHAMYL